MSENLITFVCVMNLAHLRVFSKQCVFTYRHIPNGEMISVNYFWNVIADNVGLQHSPMQ